MIDMKIKTIFLPLFTFLITTVLVSFPSICFPQEQAAEKIKALAQNAKLIIPEAILKDYRDGKSATRVIVNIREPSSFEWTQNIKDTRVRQELEKSTNRAQERVIDSLDSGQAYITNRFKYIFGFSAEVSLKGLQILVDNSDVLSIEKDEILHAHLAQGIPLMNAATVRSKYNGLGLSLAICDTGIDYTHSKLGGGGFPNTKVIGGYDTGQNDADPMDANGHGTACAGIAAGALGTYSDYIGGVAYNAKLYALKITNTTSEGSAWTSDMVEAWEWCVTHQNDDPSNPIMVISTSFGGGRYYSNCDGESIAMTTAASNALAAGMTLFVSSGNDGYCDSIGWPACISHVISVGAVYDAAFGTYYPCVSPGSCATKYPGGCSTGYYSIDSTSVDMVTSYSNTYSLLSLLAPSNLAYTTDISGSDGYSAGDYYSSFGGTSAACPYAAGAAACLQSAAKALTGSYLSPSQVKSKLVNTGDLITDGKASITKPRVNLGAAVGTLETLTLPSVTTATISSVTSTGASSGGNVTSDGGASVTARGVCWSTSANPTVSNSKTTNGTGTGTFKSTITGLISGTSYHVRAYATNTVGTSYGNDLSFTTSTTPPSVTTATISSVTSTGASSGGNVTSDGGASVTARGVCWSTSANPTVSNSKTTNGTGTGTFTSTITGLISGSSYHVRAYATNIVGTSYGNDLSFTASTIYLSKDGVCGDKNPCYTSIQDVINTASTGVIIKIAQGTYSESLTLNESKMLTLQGGWDSSFNSQTPNTTFIKAPKVPHGSLTLQMITVKP
jgi:subtilisin family serine protease